MAQWRHGALDERDDDGVRHTRVLAGGSVVQSSIWSQFVTCDSVWPHIELNSTCGNVADFCVGGQLSQYGVNF